jgi:hydroxyacylglutathione hydrolase
MYLEQIFVEGLGHASYLIASDTKEAAVVDARRDIDIYTRKALSHGFKIRYVLDTHVHNDFLSGARDLAESTGAEYVSSAEAGLDFPYRKVRDGDEIGIGEVKLKVLFTPGHTPEHVTYVGIDGARSNVPVMAFTGGDLLVGSVGRPDLLGRELGERLAPVLYDSLYTKILKLEDYVEVLPTHGGGSHCGKGIASTRTSTIGYERRFNPMLQQAGKDDFIRYLLSDSPGIPAYYDHMRPANKTARAPWRLPHPKPLSADEVKQLAGRGAVILDTRSDLSFGSAHLPGSLNIGLGSLLSTWVGWLIPNTSPLVLNLYADSDWDEVVITLARIGYDNVTGYLHGGISAWIEAGLPLQHDRQWSVHDLMQNLGNTELQVLDVRTDAEWATGHIKGAIHIKLEELSQSASALDPLRLVATVCGSGYRASTAASILRQIGFREVTRVIGGMTAWRAAAYPVTGD